MIKNGRIGTAKYYKGCLRSLKGYKPVLYFEDIDVRFVKDYQSHLLGKGNSISTSSLRLRCLRIMFNVAIKEGFVSEKHYPFKKLSLPSATKSKKVLYPQQLKLLFEYQPKSLREERAKDYFFFCFLSNGMNFKDMASLKWNNINGNTITFIRQKTKNTTTEVNEIHVHLHNEAKQIIEKWGNKKNLSDDYIFPILTKKFRSLEHAEEIRNRKRKIINNSLKAIGKQLGFDFNISINLARHSFATTLKLNGTSVAFISEMLGHTSLKTTQHYLKSIPGEERKAVSDSLLNFR
jgi:site-specific recombinase XerD